MTRFVVGAVALALFGGALSAQDADPVKDKLIAAKRAYDAEMGQVRKQVGEWFDKRVQAARDVGDPELVERFKTERAEFEDNGTLPPAAPAALKEKQDQALESLEVAYAQAAKEYTKANKTAEAAAVEAELKSIRALSGKDRDLVMDKLLAAKNAYDAETKQVRKQIEDWFETREETARKAGDKKLVDQIKAERTAFAADGELPKGVPAALKARPDKALKELEGAYAQAVKEYTKGKKDAEATAVEAELKNITAQRRVINLLALVDLKTHSVGGEWKKEGKAIEGRKRARLQLPYEPGEEYDLEVKLRRIEGDDTFGVGLVAGGRQVLALIDGWPDRGAFTGLDLVDNKEAQNNVTTAKGPLLKAGTDYVVTFSVRSEKIEIGIDGNIVSSFKGDFSRLSLRDGWGVPNKKVLFISLSGAPISIDRIKVMPIKGKGTVLK